MTGRINRALIKEKAMNSPAVARQMQKIAKVKFDKAKAEVLREFLDDVVTREIRGGANVSNASGTLGGYGNLFSYIGFYDGFDPITPIENYLKNFAFQARVAGGARGDLSIKMKFPSIGDIKALSGMPWEEGNSWVIGIERGISGFSNYMYNALLGKGRSGSATQQKSGVGKVASFSTRRYLPTLLQDAHKKLKKQI